MTALQNAPEDAEMRPWLRSVMRKLAWGQSRADSRRAQREAISHVYTPPSSDPDPLLAYGVDRQRLARAIEALPEPFRSTIVQRYIEGRSCVEIADDEQVPASTVRTRQQRALELLRSELEGQAGRRRARKRHLFWWFPLVGSGERIVARLGEDLVALLGQSKATWLVIVGLAAALGLVSLRDAAQRQHAGGSRLATAHAHHVAGASLHDANRFLTAAMLANLALGTNLGCSLITDTGGAGGSKTKVVGGGEDCVTLEGRNGQLCTTCTEPSGTETTMCAPADCYVETMPDGAICTTCADLEGNAKTLCADAPPQDCVSEMPEIGLVCTACNVDGQPETTCASAHCTIFDRCLVCQDPRGFTASDCSIDDLEVLPTYGSSVGYGSGYGLIACSSSAGHPGAATTSCDYPGLSSCTLTDGCVECTYRWGSGVGSCPFDPKDLLPEIFSGRPANLPEPGTCVEKNSPDGDMVCTTCTRGDLSASTHCRHPEALECDPFLSEDNLVCVNCRHADGSERTYCEPAS